MPNIEKFSPLSVKKIGFNLTEILLENFDENDNCIELLISINPENINIKQFSSYLDLIYKIDGMLSEIGYSRYVQIPIKQIKISEIRFGSLEIYIERFIKSIDANNLVIIGLCLKYLPQLIKTPFESASEYYDALETREDYLEKKEKRLEKKEKRKFKKDIRLSIEADENFKGVPPKLREKMIVLMVELFEKNKKNITASSKFSKKQVKSIRLKTKKKQDGS